MNCCVDTLFLPDYFFTVFLLLPPLLGQLDKKLHRIRRIHIFKKLRNLRPIFRKMQNQRILVSIRSNARLCRTRRMYHARTCLGVVDFCVNSDLFTSFSCVCLFFGERCCY
jgi:hypothetical protein